MPPNTRQGSHHALDGDELRTIIEHRVKQGILQSLNLRAMYSFPLVRYKVTIEVIPYESQGVGEPIKDAKNWQQLVVEGQEFVAVLEDAVELIHDSPVIGWEIDPQKEREDAGLGRLETRRVEGQFIDTHVGKRIQIEEPELPPPSGRRVGQVPIAPPLKPTAPKGSGGQAAKQSVMKGATVPAEPVNDIGVPEQEAERIARVEAETWAQPQMDSEIQRAIANEETLPGRVTKINK